MFEFWFHIIAIVCTQGDRCKEIICIWNKEDSTRDQSTIKFEPWIYCKVSWLL